MRIAFLFTVVFCFANCTFVQKIKDGETAYDRKQYHVAIGFLDKEYKREKSRIEKGKIAYKLAESYRLTGQESKSAQWYQIAYDNSFGVDALKGYAYSLKSTEQYKEAEQAFKDLSMEIGSPYEYRHEVKVCQEAADWLTEDTGVEVTNLPINSAGSDYAPMLLSNDQILFTSDRGGVGSETYEWTGKNFSDLFVANLSSYDVELYKEAAINTIDNEGTSSVSADGNTIIFTRCYNPDKFTDSYCQLYESKKEDNAWSQAIPLSFTEDKVNYMHPSISEDGSTLFFSADNEGGWGGFDIYFVERNPEGWDEPQLLDLTVNTEGNEKFPFFQGDKLYFASDAHPGLGGLDIFVSKKMSRNSWTKAENLRYPINSGKDDFGFILAPTDQSDTTLLMNGYFSSNRKGGVGADDIFSFTKREVEKPEVIIPDTQDVAEIEYKILLKGYVVEKIYEFADNPNSRVLGRRPLANAKVGVTPKKPGAQIETNEMGFFELELAEDEVYQFIASKAEYLNNTASFDTRGIAKDPNNPTSEFEIEILLDKIFKNTEITLSNIYYDFDEYFIRDDAKPTLNVLAETLQRNPSISIQLSSHTDCQGNNSYNENLSQQRAQAAVDYLISLGIESTRLSAVGYGENSPAVDCACNKCDDDQHQANRRTTFKVLD